MGKRKTIQSVSGYINEIQDVIEQLDGKIEEFTIWADKDLYGKNYKGVFNHLLESAEYDLIDQGLAQNGTYKKNIQLLNDPVFKIILYHDKNDLLTTVLVERV